jgi:hypothetical protein
MQGSALGAEEPGLHVRNGALTDCPGQGFLTLRQLADLDGCSKMRGRKETTAERKLPVPFSPESE